MNEITSNRDEYIYDEVLKHFEEASSLGHEVFCLCLQGSQNYGLDIYTNEYKSDIDTKAIILPSFDGFCRGKQPISHTHVRENNSHIDLKDIREMFSVFKKQNVNFVEILFTDYYVVPSKYAQDWQKVMSLGESLTHCHPAQTLRTMSGMSMEKRKALCHPYPTIIDKINKHGYDGKQLHHIIRINSFMKNYIDGMPFKQCLVSYNEQEHSLMLDAKLNKFSLERALELADIYDVENRKLKDKYIERYGDKCDDTAYKILDEIKVDILKRWFKEQLGEKR